MKTDRLVEIERGLVPDLDKQLHDIKRQKQQLEKEADGLRKELLAQTNKNVETILFSTSDPTVFVQALYRHKAVNIVDAINEA